MYKKRIIIISILLILSSFVSAEDFDVIINPNIVRGGKILEITVKPVTKFYRYAYVYDSDEEYSGFINVKCGRNRCNKKSKGVFAIPSEWKGRYYVSVFDYSERKWKNYDFEVVKSKGKTRKGIEGESVKGTKSGERSALLATPYRLPTILIFILTVLILATLLFLSIKRPKEKKISAEKLRELQEYIIKLRMEGLGDDDIQSYLIAYGWGSDVVDKAYSKLDET